MHYRQFVINLLTVGLLLFNLKAHASTSNEVTISNNSKYRYIKANGLPDHDHGKFPNRGNPHRVSAQSYQFRVTLLPKLTERIQPTGRYTFGVAINGVPFDPGSAEYWKNDRSTGWRKEALNVPGKLGMDHHNAHVTFFEGNYTEYEADRVARLGADAAGPHRIKYKRIDA
ncbi:energy-dependent translational throttle protein EttA [Elysia marginata]|uniref:Energy-dependent translational throttle protein EttA n=1 Tax=Elysia marginata TaxID=1093978 RepID=A0AAV4GZ40_9GAST|nr:energy-dependent translational throttle protein EttA [Elysia marginata]